MATSGSIYKTPPPEKSTSRSNSALLSGATPFFRMARWPIAQRMDMHAPLADTHLGNILVADPHCDRQADPEQTQLVTALAACGYAVYTLSSAAEVQDFVAQTSIDVVLLAVTLTDRSGFELCTWLKQFSQTRFVPVLFTGESDNKHDRLKAFEVGAVDFIPKPYWVEEVVARIQLHLSQAQQQRRVKHHTARAFPNRAEVSLLAKLQRTLQQQTLRLREQNVQLQKEVHERQLMEKALRHEQQKSEQLLLNILPEAIVDQLKHFQGSLAQRFDEATVLFADIVNFTPLAAQMRPLELVAMLNKIFSAFDRLAEKYQLEKIKTIGDAYMVVGGVPVPTEGHAVAIADMALEMQTVAQQFEVQPGQPLQLRIGINTGTVVAGVIGIKKFSYDLWGNTVNVASRMEAQGTAGKIQVTEATYQYLKDAFVLEPARELEVKGKGRMTTYHLLGRVLP